MSRYRGYYIDHVVFNSREDIDKRIKAERISKLKKYTAMLNCPRYSRNEIMDVMGCMMDIERNLVHEDGLTWEEIEQLEIKIMNK